MNDPQPTPRPMILGAILNMTVMACLTVALIFSCAWYGDLKKTNRILEDQLHTFVRATTPQVVVSNQIMASTNVFFEPTIRWQFDEVREQFKKWDAEDAAAIEFDRTNTNPTMHGIGAGRYFQWKPTKDQVELGYRSDGIVVWRPLPEAPK